MGVSSEKSGPSGTASSASLNRGAGRSRWVVLIYLLFFLSGLTSLIYEVIWVRQFGLVFGVTTYAVSAVLAAFFAGLAIGSYVAGRLIDRTRLHPLAVYGVMEGIVGAYALVLPFFLKLVETTYPAVYSGLAENFSLFTLFRFLVCFALLVVPTTLMGATLPVLSKLMVDRESILGLNVGRLYAVNTFGAVTGTFSAGFLLIPAIGVLATTLTAAIGNFLLCAAALLMARLSLFAVARAAAASDATTSAAPPLSGTDRLVLVLAFASGFAALALEVVWARSLVLILGSTTYAFSTMLTAVLVGIAAGSAVFARFADPTRNRGALVAFLLFTGGFCAVLGPAVINRLPFLFLRLYDWAWGVWGLIIATQFAVCFALVFIPTFLSGASFPILVRMYSRGLGRVGRTVADVYAINTFGGILGSLVGGFVLVKFLGLQPSLTVAALFLMLVGGCLGIALARPWRPGVRAAIAAVMAASVVVLAFAHPRFKTKLLFAGWGPYAGGYYVSRMGGSTVDVTARYMQRNLYHKEGVTASVDVLETGWGEKIISINAKPVATTYVYDMRALKMLGHLPVLLHPQPQDVLIIGLGAGVSSGIIASYQAVQDVTVVELCEEVPGGAAQFEDWNHDVIHNPKVKIVINDGANYVKATRKQYDVISADPIHPFVSGAGTLYSAEHWSICKDRLREGGILAQWLPLYQLSVDDFATIVRTFVEVFPSASMWFSGIDTVLVGSKGPFKIDPDRLAEHMSAPAVIADLLSMGVHQPADVLGWFAAGPPELRAAGGDAAINSVNLPILEFSAPKSVGRRGVGSTVPALLAANEKLAQHEFQRRLNDMCTRPLDSQALRSASIAREAWRWLMRAQLLYSYDYPNQCLDAIARSYELRPNDRFIRRALAEAWYGVGDQQRDDGYLWDALRAFREAMAKDPHNANALTSSVETALELNHVDLADSILLLATPEQKKIFQVLISSGMVALRRSDYEVARKAFEEASSRGQESPRMHVGLGIVRLREGQSDSANGHFERAIQISTSPVYTLYDIVNLCTGHGFSAAARQYAEQLLAPASACIAADPGRPLFYEYRALAYSALGDKKNAAQDRATARSLADWWEGSAAAGSAQSPPEI